MAPGRESTAGPLSVRNFRLLWIGGLALYLALWMQVVGASWLMLSLAPSPLMVALIQTAQSLPVFVLVLPAGVLADVVDLDSKSSGKQQAGAFFSIWSMVAKSALAFGVLAGTGLAAWFGFDPKADPMHTTNTTFALLMLAVLYSIVPAMFKFVAMPFLWNYPLTEARVQEIQAEILAQREAA